MRILIADTETTGVDKDSEICELAFFEVDENLNILSRFCSLVNPRGLISPAASGASGITNLMVENEPTIEEVLEGFEPGFFDDVLLAAHNCGFDKRMLEPFWNISGTLCTLRAARHWFPDSPDHRLQTLRHYLDMEIDADRHRAEADVEVTLLLLKHLMRAAGVKTLTELIQIESQPRTVAAMPWGKHRGAALHNLPSGYVNWLLGLPDLDDDLRVSLQNRFNL